MGTRLTVRHTCKDSLGSDLAAQIGGSNKVWQGPDRHQKQRPLTTPKPFTQLTAAAYCNGSLHTQSKGTCWPGSQVMLPRLLSRFPRERAGPGAAAVSGLISPKGKTDKLCRSLRIPAKAATLLPQIPQPHSPLHCRARPSGLSIPTHYEVDFSHAAFP